MTIAISYFTGLERRKREIPNIFHLINKISHAWEVFESDVTIEIFNYEIFNSKKKFEYK